MARDGLTPKQQRFVDEYLIDPNATVAYKAAYGVTDDSTAAVNGARLLRNAKVAAQVAQAQAARAERVQVKQDDVLRELMRLGFSNMRSFAKWGPQGVTLKSVEELNEDESRCVAEVSQTISKEGGSIKFKLHDKPSALEKIGRHLGMFNDKLHIEGEIKHGVVILPAVSK